jgi:hypothetical protein
MSGTNLAQIVFVAYINKIFETRAISIRRHDISTGWFNEEGTP